MADISVLFGAVLLVDAMAFIALLWIENFTRYEGVVLWEEESPITPLFWGSAIVLFAGVLSLIEIPVAAHAQVRVNVGGVVAPLAVCALIFWRHKPKPLAAILAIGGTTAGTLAATAISSEAFSLPLPWGVLPGAIGGAIGVALARSRPSSTLDLAYIGAVVGCLLGLDVIPFTFTLGSPSGAPDVTFGAGGILDLVFLSGVFAVTFAWAVGFVRALVRHGPARPLAMDPGDPETLRREYDAGGGRP